MPELDDTYVPFTGIDTTFLLDSSTNSKTHHATIGHFYETIT